MRRHKGAAVTLPSEVKEKSSRPAVLKKGSGDAITFHVVTRKGKKLSKNQKKTSKIDRYKGKKKAKYGNRHFKRRSVRQEVSNP